MAENKRKTMKKLSQRQAVFAVLLRNDIVTPYSLVGMTVRVGDREKFLSYKAPSRLTEIYQDLWLYLGRSKPHGKNYYIYRLNKETLLEDYVNSSSAIPKVYREVVKAIVDG